MSFSFGTPSTTTGTPAPDSNPTGGFTFGANLGAGDAKAAPTKPLGFGAPQTSTPLPTFGGFGAAPAATPQSTGFTIGGTSAATNLTNTSGLGTTPSTFNLGATPASTGSALGGASSTPAAGGFSLGATPTAASAFKLGGAAPAAAATTATSAPGFGLLGTPKTTSTAATTTASVGFSLGGSLAATTATAPALNLGGSLTATTSASSFGFGASTAKTTTTATVTPTFSLGGAAKTTATTGFSLTTPASTSTTALTTTTSAIPATGNLNYGQLVDAINKWTIDLEEQGKLFSNQAKQLNAWDRLLVSNGEKVLSLNSGIERVKQQQQQLDQELDFVLAQQKELEDLIKPLEKELNEIPLTDVDRVHTYQLAENMDTQLKQMSEDLKEIIEQLNESNKTQENSNPITQIRKILNAHMDSLQWIDRHTSKITGHLDQISKMHDLHRQSHEHSLKKTYD
ncbi:nuclear pore glycoprotein p62 [Atheta coriaria]|uniref:nuclear pore glycoprotein p62 n=1 Tax=Dalotia coriaria TaxID=877792 RepID=UPI0031F43346